MRSFRRLLTAIGPVGLCGLVAVSGAIWTLPGHAAASLQAAAWIEVRPSPVTAGRHVALRADCGSGETAATVTSTAFGRVSLHPFAGYLFAEVLVPTSTRAGGHSVSLACSNGETASTTLRVSRIGHADRRTLVPVPTPAAGSWPRRTGPAGLRRPARPGGSPVRLGGSSVASRRWPPSPWRWCRCAGVAPEPARAGGGAGRSRLAVGGASIAAAAAVTALTIRCSSPVPERC